MERKKKMCRGCEGWNYEDLYMCVSCRMLDITEKILRILLTIILTFALGGFIDKFGELFLPSLHPDKGTLSSALLPLLGFLFIWNREHGH
jgi:hypothetical protein